MTRLLEKCDERNHGQKKKQKEIKKIKKKPKKTKKTLKRNPEAKCIVCTWLKNQYFVKNHYFSDFLRQIRLKKWPNL